MDPQAELIFFNFSYIYLGYRENIVTVQYEMKQSNGR